MANAVVLGCGRSGTSIFGELFAALPGFTYLSEPLLSERGVGRAVRRGPVAVKVPRTEPGASPPPGCSVDLDALFAAIPAPRVVFWQVRHPLDAVASLRVGIGEGWDHHPRPPDWEGWLDRPLVERCAHHWAVINTAGWDQVADIAVVNRFEDMVGDQVMCADRTARLVGVDPADAADLPGWTARVRDRDDGHFVEAFTSRPHSRPDHDRRIGRWQDDLTAEEVARLVPLVAEAAARFGYDLSGAGDGAGSAAGA